MRKTRVLLCAALAAPCLLFAQDRVNLLKNGELKFDDGGKLGGWGGNAVCVRDKGFKGPDSARAVIEKQGKTFCQLTMTQWLTGLKPGKYIFSSYIKLDRKVYEILICRIIKVDGKDVYQTEKITPQDQPEPGEWTKVMAELDIPSGCGSALTGFDIRDKTPGAVIWIDSPAFYYKSEQ